jgi:hypothetical protein
MQKNSIIFLVLLGLFLSLNIYALPPQRYNPNTMISPDRIRIDPGESVNFNVHSDHNLPAPVYGCGPTTGKLDYFIVDFGDGKSSTGPCSTFSFPHCFCETTINHQFTSVGSYTVSITGCANGSNPPCDYPGGTTTVWVGIDPPIDCDRTCNQVCASACSGVNEDPDCGCLSGNSCCPAGCDINSDNDCQGGNSEYNNPILSNNIVEFIWHSLYLLFGFVLALSILFMLIGAYIIVASGGNMARTTKGKKIITLTLIGFAISLIGRGIMALILTVMKD